jgi:hypothetical protein
LDEQFGAFVPSIGRANLDGSGVNESFISVPGGGARGLAVDSLIPSTTTLTPSQGSIAYGQPVTFTAAVTGASVTPTGTVQFQVDGTNEGSPVVLDANGRAAYTPSFPLDVGATVSVAYSGNANYGTSNTSLRPSIQPASTSLSLESSSNPQASGGEVTFTATVTNSSTEVIPFGSVQFLIDGEPVLAPLPLENNGQVGITGAGLPPGDYTVTALYHDDTLAIPDFTDSRASVTEHITSPPASPPALASTVSPHITVTPVRPNSAFRTLRASAGPDGTLDLTELAPDPGTFTAVANMTSSRLRAATANRAAKCRKGSGACRKGTQPRIYGTASATVSVSGEVRLVIKPRAAARKTLNTGRTLHVTVTITFRSAHGGSPATQTASLTVKPHKAKRR